MSIPSYPAIDPPIKLEEALSMIVASIAMEELGFSHIINAESEKLKYVLEKGSDGDKASVKEVLAVNKSIKNLLDSIMQNQILLKSKMQCALDAMDCHRPTGTVGPTGPTGPTGRFLL